MTITTAIYKCDYCEFTSTSAKETGKHEHKCIHSPIAKAELIKNKFKREKIQLRNDLLLAVSIDELNELVLKYIEIFYSESASSYYYSSKDKCIFRIDRYNLIPYNPYSLEQIGIKTHIEDYPNIKALIDEYQTINKISSEYNTAFNKHRERTYNELNILNPDIISLEVQIKDISLQITELQNNRESTQAELEILKNNLINQIKEEYGFIDHNIRVKELKDLLRVKT